MDTLADLLDGPRARGAFLLTMVMEPPWSVRVEDGAPLSLMIVREGTAWIRPLEGDPVRLSPGDVAIARGPDPYTVSDALDSPVQWIIHDEERCTTLFGDAPAESMSFGVRMWGNRPDGSATMLVGTYFAQGAVERRLLAALPPLAVLPGWDSPLAALLGEEIVRDAPGQPVVLDRLLDLILIAVLRAWFSRPGARAPGWFAAHGDPVVGPALRLLHDHPARAWTVADLAAEAGASRAALAKRFGDLVGEPPMTYLTGLRLAHAADLLRGGDLTLEAIARKVGYGSAFALSAAFKRERGVSPQEYRSGDYPDASLEPAPGPAPGPALEAGLEPVPGGAPDGT
ncbi:AraC family transcriptional regulator [Actinomadura rupiterrae]|uniref:AraC family transcriptional regulator n=1 Tax=Actinomadura rupiterrae TaxID=559627 RepID=UPI0020A5B2F1|nr:AraC family transcriptional regulator [Actinomadura rupiterrae]MCP2341731.1 AraC-like DNA-binding protein [Actinomadura rupiterrae]